MKINWFPGHMNKSQKNIKKLFKNIDICLEILDARIISASQNPIFNSWKIKNKTIKIINKIDLADPIITKKWIFKFKKEKMSVLSINKNFKNISKYILHKINNILIKKGNIVNPIKIIVIGIPNVGKSSIINQLVKKKICQVANIASVTRNIKEVKFKKGKILIYDTPGVMWTGKSCKEEYGYHLALCTAIKNIAFKYIDITIFLINHLKRYYSNCLKKKYGIQNFLKDSEDIIKEIGKNQNLISCNKNVSNIFILDKISRRIIQDFQSSKLGRISLDII